MSVMTTPCPHSICSYATELGGGRFDCAPEFVGTPTQLAYRSERLLAWSYTESFAEFLFHALR
jgi:hypothetical protein